MTKSSNVKRLEMEENYLTVSEVMRYFKISRSSAYALTRRKDFPVCLIGGSIRIPESLFLTWLKKQTSVNSVRISIGLSFKKRTLCKIHAFLQRVLQ